MVQSFNTTAWKSRPTQLELLQRGRAVDIGDTVLEIST